MRIISFSIFLLILFSCEPPKESSPASQLENSKKEKVIQSEPDELDFGFNPNHPNASQFNALLNSFEESFTPTTMNWVEWKNLGLVQERYSYITSVSGTTLYLIFCASQNDCISVCSLNFEPTTETMKWGVNGAVAFVVIGEDSFSRDNLLGHLAGEE